MKRAPFPTPETRNLDPNLRTENRGPMVEYLSYV